MNLDHPLIILSTTPTQKERFNNKRNLSGYQCFCSMYWTDFSSSLTTEQKQTLLIEKGVHDAVQYERDDDDSVFSDSDFAPSITLGDVSALASMHWRGLSLPCRDAWKTRARTTINNLPILGRLPTMPRRINNKTILDSLNQELSQFIKRVQSGVKRKPRTRDSQVSFYYVYEKITVHSQTFRSFNITPLLIGIIFGTGFDHLFEREILYKSNKVVVMHISTMKRANELLTIEGVSAFRSDSLNSNCYFTAASKVSLKLENEAPVVGYLLETVGEGEGDELAKVALENGRIVHMPMPRFNDQHHWEFDSPFLYQHQWYYITHYWPIRLKINLSGMISLLFNRIQLENITNRLIPMRN